MRSHLRALTDRLSFYEWAYGRMAEADSDLGPIAEYLVGSSLGCLPDSRRVSAPYDLVLPDGRTVEVKATAKRKTMSRGRPPIYRWGVSTQFSEPNKKLADLWFFLIAEFPALAPRRFDVFDPKSWTVRIVTGPELATAGVTRYMTERTLDRLGATPQPFAAINKYRHSKPAVSPR